MNKEATMHKGTWIFPGRWQPFHAGHMAIADIKLGAGFDVLFLVRDTLVSPENPYTVQQRMAMIRLAYGDLYGTRVLAMPIPDFVGIGYGRGVGYDVEEIDVGAAIQSISATSIRKGECAAMAAKVSEWVKRQRTTYWFTGLPCSGKTTLCNALAPRLRAEGYNVVTLDGDDVRAGLCSDLGFSEEDREENIRRMAHLCNMYNRQNTLVLASFISPSTHMQDMVRSIVDSLEMIHVSTPLEVCERRDTKGMYALARAGKIPEFTGISAPYTAPEECFEIDASGDICTTVFETLTVCFGMQQDLNKEKGHDK